MDISARTRMNEITSIAARDSLNIASTKIYSELYDDGFAHKDIIEFLEYLVSRYITINVLSGRK